MTPFGRLTHRHGVLALLATTALVSSISVLLLSVDVDWNALHRHAVEVRVAFWRATGRMPARPTQPAPWPWSAAQPSYADRDVLVILKTGWQTQSQLEAALQFLDRSRTASNTVIISDHASDIQGGNLSSTWVVHDVIEPLAKDALYNGSEVVKMYEAMHAYIRADKMEDARAVKGWHIDRLKNVPGFQLAYRLHPGYKWYIMIDDDTFLHFPSLLTGLRGLDADRAHYLGTSLDGTIRVAYGGGGIVLSQGAVRLLHFAAPGYLRDTVWNGRESDIALGWALAQAAGVHLAEDRSLVFAGGTPDEVPIDAARACVPAATLHHIKPRDFAIANDRLSHVNATLSWLGMWNAFATSHEMHERRQGWTYNYGETPKYGKVAFASDKGPLDEDGCKKSCSEGCMAWTWRKDQSSCFIGNVLTVGRADVEAVSGVNVARISELEAICNP
ncbi:hypothetical protein EXIGLDRAFT_721040 [Exidia glandulosa HHB12029]|uniref:N-acetylgalactosaminide beta-1,3-galactosyltransferase n=1 Tax=Exidia glandulosa HHB12029 TaxID=1314781 RepID=A0A165G0C6_EXIGL|nr:hypothetical protein EXIGLDRAFT_721040 [Exidia glandulosa HHB12029]